MRQLPRLAAIAALALLASACGSSNDNNASSGTSSPAATTPAATTTAGTTTSGGGGGEAEIEIEGFQYTVPASVSPGATIKVVNKDSTDHTVTSGTAGQFDSGDVAGGGTGTFTAPAAAGSYAITCTFHPNMHGTLVVK